MHPVRGMEWHLGIHKVEDARIFRKSAHEGGKIVSPLHRPPSPPHGGSLVLISGRI